MMKVTSTKGCKVEQKYTHTCYIPEDNLIGLDSGQCRYKPSPYKVHGQSHTDRDVCQGHTDGDVCQGHTDRDVCIIRQILTMKQ